MASIVRGSLRSLHFTTHRSSTAMTRVIAATVAGVRVCAIPSLSSLRSRRMLSTGNEAVNVVVSEAVVVRPNITNLTVEQQVKAEARKVVLLSEMKANGSTPRFYNRVGMEEMDGGYAITLGDHLVQTPRGKTVILPTLDLATAIALEWDSQVNRIKPHTMPLMHLATVAIDQIPTAKPLMVAAMMEAAQFDAVCYGADEPESLVRLQKKVWAPVLAFMEEELAAPYKTGVGIVAVKQSQETLEIVDKILRSQNDWVLASLDSIIALTKSAGTALALFMHGITVDQAYNASRCDNDWQMRLEGKVDGMFGHDIDIEHHRLKLGAARTFLNLLGPLGVYDPAYVHPLHPIELQADEKSKKPRKSAAFLSAMKEANAEAAAAAAATAGTTTTTTDTSSTSTEVSAAAKKPLIVSAKRMSSEATERLTREMNVANNRSRRVSALNRKLLLDFEAMEAERNAAKLRDHKLAATNAATADAQVVGEPTKK